jgi:hypothetical protein
MGLQADRLTPNQFRAHLSNVKQAYQKLEANTPVRLDQSSIIRLINHNLNLSRGITDEEAQAAKLANHYLTKMQSIKNQQLVGRNASGRFTPATTNSVNWQNLRSDLKEDIASARDRGDNFKVRALLPYVEELDNAIVNGMIAKGRTAQEGQALVGQWKDLNEQYAMGKLLQDHGLDSFGNVNPKKLDRYFLINDAERYLSGAGGRVRDLHDIARLGAETNRQSGSSLSGLNESKTGKDETRTERQILLSTPAALVPKPLTELYFRAYRNGYPQVTGLLPFMTGQGLKDTGLYTRALAQSSQLYPNAVEGVENAIDVSRKSYAKLSDYIKKLVGNK